MTFAFLATKHYHFNGGRFQGTEDVQALEGNAALQGVEAVSYTHLDVYKRQVQSLWL